MILFLVLLCKEFAKSIQAKFEMSMMEKLNYFLGLQIKQSKEGIFINQAKGFNKKVWYERCKVYKYSNEYFNKIGQ